jgi:hypothetical protein
MVASGRTFWRVVQRPSTDAGGRLGGKGQTSLLCLFAPRRAPGRRPPRAQHQRALEDVFETRSQYLE